MIREIVTFPNAVLREKAKLVEQLTEEHRRLIRDMFETMREAPGIGLAAPQVGVSQQIIVVDAKEAEGSRHSVALINPKILEKEGRVESDEGCLSLPDLRVVVDRAERIIVEAELPDVAGRQTITAEGLFAIVLQHEIDHLNGVLLLDYMSSLKRGMYVARRTKRAKQ